MELLIIGFLWSEVSDWMLLMVNDNFVNLIHDAIKRVNKENIVIGEVWEDASFKISYNQRRRYFNGRLT